VKYLILGIVVVIGLAVTSLFLGFLPVTLSKLYAGDADAWLVFWQTRLPRTASLILAGMSLALSGMIMQILSRNRFVEPTTAGTVESAAFGILIVMIFAPGIPVIGKMLVSAAFAMAGSFLFIFLLRRIPLISVLMVPLTGIMLGYVIGAATNAIADQQMLLPSLQAYLFGSFSMIIDGKYELLWLAVPLAVLAYISADRFTVAGMGDELASNLGLRYQTVLIEGLLIISLTTAIVVCTVGRIPFVGLVVPNVVAIFLGDNMKNTAPWVALSGAGLVLLCDILGRLISSNSEIPVGTMMGVVGSGAFIILLLHWRKRLG